MIAKSEEEVEPARRMALRFRPSKAKFNAVQDGHDASWSQVQFQMAQREEEDEGSDLDEI